MSRAIRPEMSMDIATHQREIADAVENLMADTFIDRTQRILNRSVRSEDDQILRRHAFSITLAFSASASASSTNVRAYAKFVMKTSGENSNVSICGRIGERGP